MGCSGSTAAVKKTIRPNWERDKEGIKNLMYETYFDQNAVINNDFHLELNYTDEIHKDFIQKCTPYRFPNLKYVEISGIQQHSKEANKDLSQFFSKCMPYEVDYLVLKNKVKKDEHQDKLVASRQSVRGSEIKKTKTLGALTEHGAESALDYLVLSFDNVVKEVLIERFDFDNYTLALVLEHACNVERLVLSNCTIKIDEKLTLSTSKTYHIQYLDLFNSYFPSDASNLNIQGLDILARVMANTTLHTSLKNLHIATYMTDGKDLKGKKEQELFDNRKYKLNVFADHTWPKTNFNDKKIYVNEW